MTAGSDEDGLPEHLYFTIRKKFCQFVFYGHLLTFNALFVELVHLVQIEFEIILLLTFMLICDILLTSSIRGLTYEKEDR